MAPLTSKLSVVTSGIICGSGVVPAIGKNYSASAKRDINAGREGEDVNDDCNICGSKSGETFRSPLASTSGVFLREWIQVAA